jgi:hypothetical protein
LAASDSDAGRRRCTPSELVLTVGTPELCDVPQPAAKSAERATAVATTIELPCIVRTEADSSKAALNRV